MTMVPRGIIPGDLSIPDFLRREQIAEDNAEDDRIQRDKAAASTERIKVMTTLFKKAEVTSANLKMGIMGFAGSGKTFTATDTAIGLIGLMREKKIAGAERPMFFLDTETGSDWVKPRVEAAGIELYTAKTRAFSDLLTSVREAQGQGSLLLIDSISHFWTELCESYLKKKGRTRLQFEDWAYLKHEWRKFTDMFVNSPLHIILCGRAGYEYDYFEDQETGKKQLEKTDIKMKAENEMGYEPSLLVLMERHTDMETKKVYRVATILKDRATAIDGRQFRDPTFTSFLPHIERLNLGGTQLGVDASRTSEAMIPADKREHGPVQRRIVVNEIQDLLVEHVPGMAAADKKRKIELLRKHFKASWTEIEEVMPLFDLRAGYECLHLELTGEPGRYTAGRSAPAEQKPAAPAAPAAEADDEIFDGEAWLAKTEEKLNVCTDVHSLMAVSEAMSPDEKRLTKEQWETASNLVMAAFRRIDGRKEAAA